MATADSSTNKAIWLKINTVNIKVDNIFPVLLIRVNNKCPAIIFAVNRTAKVPGRIILLIVSIQTIKGIKTPGVPWGTRCINICWVWFNHP